MKSQREYLRAWHAAHPEKREQYRLARLNAPGAREALRQYNAMAQRRYRQKEPDMQAVLARLRSRGMSVTQRVARRLVRLYGPEYLTLRGLNAAGLRWFREHMAFAVPEDRTMLLIEAWKRPHHRKPKKENQ